METMEATPIKLSQGKAIQFNSIQFESMEVCSRIAMLS